MLIEFFIFWIAATVGAIAVMPYQFKMLKGKMEIEANKKTTKKVPPTSVLILISILQSVIFLGISSYIGTLLAPKVDLHWWILEYWIKGTTIPYSVPALLILSVVVAFILALVIIVFDVFFSKRMPKYEFEEPTKTQALLASLYGGISEEVLTRLFVMTLFVSLASWIGVNNFSYWIGIILAAVLFGVGHLPAAFSLIGKTKIVAIRTILLNTIPGIVFGYLFWKYGIEIAMVTHFFGDIFLHVIIGPYIRRRIKMGANIEN